MPQLCSWPGAQRQGVWLQAPRAGSWSWAWPEAPLGLKHKPEAGGDGETQNKCLFKTINYIPFAVQQTGRRAPALQDRRPQHPEK